MPILLMNAVGVGVNNHQTQQLGIGINNGKSGEDGKSGEE